MSHVERMKVELSELTTKIEALDKFIESSPIFQQLPDEERADMVEQLQGMGEYQYSLKRRLERATK